MLDKLNGYKTYICGALFVIVEGLKVAGVLDGHFSPATIGFAESVLAAGGAIALRAGVAKAENAAKASS